MILHLVFNYEHVGASIYPFPPEGNYFKATEQLVKLYVLYNIYLHSLHLFTMRAYDRDS